MLRKTILQKLFMTTLMLFLILSISTIPITIQKPKVLRTNLEIKDITNLPTSPIYLLNKDNLLVKENIFIEKTEKIIPEIINYLTIGNNNIPVSLQGYIPKKVKLLDYSEKNGIITLNFSKELANSNNLNTIVTGIVYSLIEIESINKVSITVDNKLLNNYPSILDKSIGINNKYEINSRQDIQKVTIFYLDKDNNYLPITKYVNDKRDKIEIIIEELKKADNNNTISPLNINTNLLDYNEEFNTLYLNFNKYLLDNNKEENKKILNTIAYSVFENYDVNVVMFEIQNKKIEYLTKN